MTAERWTFATGKPPEDGMYAAYSEAPERAPHTPSLYAYKDGVFQHYTGWYDHAITHWLKLDIPLVANTDLEGAD